MVGVHAKFFVFPNFNFPFCHTGQGLELGFAHDPDLDPIQDLGQEVEGRTPGPREDPTLQNAQCLHVVITPPEDTRQEDLGHQGIHREDTTLLDVPGPHVGQLRVQGSDHIQGHQYDDGHSRDQGLGHGVVEDPQLGEAIPEVRYVDHQSADHLHVDDILQDH